MANFLLAGGGSAGHVNPLLATAAELRRRHPDARIEALGTSSGLEMDLVPAAGFHLNTIPRVRIPRGPSTELFTLPGRIRSALATTGRIFDDLQPDVVVGFGGDLSFPAYHTAFKRGIPVVVQEQNARPGLSNRYGARRAAVVAVTFPSTPLEAKRGTRVVTGLPLRPAVAGLVERFARGEARAAREEAARSLGLDPNLPTLLITGGSLGAASINSAAADALLTLAEAGQVLHLTGRGKIQPVERAMMSVESPDSYHVREYLSEMERAYAVADLVLTRSGAGMVSELGALGIPAVYVPLPVGNGEQKLNAQDLVEAGGGLLLEDADLDATWLRENLVPLWTDRARLDAMAAAARGTLPADGAARIVDQIEGLL